MSSLSPLIGRRAAVPVDRFEPALLASPRPFPPQRPAHGPGWRPAGPRRSNVPPGARASLVGFGTILVLVQLVSVHGVGADERSEIRAADPPATLATELLHRETLVGEVLERNPSIDAARAALNEAEARRSRVGALEDPMAGMTTAPLSWFGGHGEGYGFSVRQALPYPGTLGLREERVAAEARAREQDIEALRAELALEAARLFDRYVFVDRALEINREHLELLLTFRDVATGRYAAGLVPQQAPIQAEVESVHLEHRRVVLEGERRRLVAQLNALLHRDAEAELPPPASSLERPSLPASLTGERPEIAALEARIEGGRTAVQLEELGAKPSFEVSSSYSSMWAEPRHRWMVGIGVRVPLGRKRIQAGIAEAEARVEGAESTLEVVRDRFAAEVALAKVDLEESLQVVDLYENRVLPATQDQITAARSGFETGQLTMLALIEAERSLRTARLELAEALTRAWTARARLDRALGRIPAFSPSDVPAGVPSADSRALPAADATAADADPTDPASRDAAPSTPADTHSPPNP